MGGSTEVTNGSGIAYSAYMSPKLLNNTSPTSLAVEALIIVVSILLAFAIDAWWDKRGDLETQRALLESMLVDSRENIAGLRRTIAEAEADQALIEKFYQHPEAEDGQYEVSDAEVSAYWTSFVKPHTYVVSNGAIAGAIRSSESSIITDPEIQTLLQQVAVQFEEVKERSDIMAGQEVQSHAALARHRLIRDRIFGIDRQSENSDDLQSVRDDEDVAARVAAMSVLRGVHIRELEKLLSLYEQLESQLERRVAG
jgi:hypothetical protein